MDLIIDANILFSVIIKSGKTEEIMFKTDMRLFAPEFIFEEFHKYKDLLLEKTERTDDEYERLVSILARRIYTVPNEGLKEYIAQARKICPDEKDVAYFALALKLRCAIWSNDKLLKGQDKVIIYSTHELTQLI